MSRLILALSFVVLVANPVMAGVLDDLGAAVDNAAKDVGAVIDDVEEKIVSEPSTSSEAPSSSDANNTSGAHDVQDGDLWGETRYQWGQNFDPNSVKTIKVDVTCDGHVDYVASRLNQDNPDGPFFDILIVTRDDGKLSSEPVSVRFDGSQDGLCGDARVDIDVSVEHWDEGQLDGALGGWEGICTEAVRVDDGMCDAMRYFWLTGERNPDEPRLMSFRN